MTLGVYSPVRFLHRFFFMISAHYYLGAWEQARAFSVLTRRKVYGTTGTIPTIRTII